MYKGMKQPFVLFRHMSHALGSDQSFPMVLAPCEHPCTRTWVQSWYQLPSRFHSFCRAFLLLGLTGAHIPPVRLLDFHNNIFRRTGYISNQLLHHSMFQHKYMQCSAATILLGVFLCNTDRRINPRAPVLRELSEQTAPQHTLHCLKPFREKKTGAKVTNGNSPDIQILYPETGTTPWERGFHHLQGPIITLAREVPALAAGEAWGNTTLFPLLRKG